MRPEDFSPGNVKSTRQVRLATHSGFNEAGGFLPRKRRHRRTVAFRSYRFNEAGGFLPRKQLADGAVTGAKLAASMRPEDFSPGNAAEEDRQRQPPSPMLQ